MTAKNRYTFSVILLLLSVIISLVGCDRHGHTIPVTTDPTPVTVKPVKGRYAVWIQSGDWGVKVKKISGPRQKFSFISLDINAEFASKTKEALVKALEKVHFIPRILQPQEIQQQGFDAQIIIYQGNSKAKINTKNSQTDVALYAIVKIINRDKSFYPIAVAGKSSFRCRSKDCNGMAVDRIITGTVSKSLDSLEGKLLSYVQNTLRSSRRSNKVKTISATLTNTKVIAAPGDGTIKSVVAIPKAADAVRAQVRQKTMMPEPAITPKPEPTDIPGSKPAVAPTFEPLKTATSKSLKTATSKPLKTATSKPPPPAPEPATTLAPEPIKTAPPVATMKAIPEKVGVAESVQETAIREEIEQTLHNWASAWSSKKVKEYLAFYSDKFLVSEKFPSRQAWKKQRRQALGKAGPIRVELSNMKITIFDESHAKITFSQKYTSKHFKDQIDKAISLQKESGAWRIWREYAL